MRVVESGDGAAVVGHPAEEVAWLANAVAQLGFDLEAHHVIMSDSV